MSLRNVLVFLYNFVYFFILDALLFQQSVNGYALQHSHLVVSASTEILCFKSPLKQTRLIR